MLGTKCTEPANLLRRTALDTQYDALLQMPNIAVAALPCQHCGGAPQHDGASATHIRQHSLSNSAPSASATQLSLTDLMQVSGTTAGASWSMASDVLGGGGHCRKGSQESVRFPGSLASDSFCSTTFTGGPDLHHEPCGCTWMTGVPAALLLCRRKPSIRRTIVVDEVSEQLRSLQCRRIGNTEP